MTTGDFQRNALLESARLGGMLSERVDGVRRDVDALRKELNDHITAQQLEEKRKEERLSTGRFSFWTIFWMAVSTIVGGGGLLLSIYNAAHPHR